MKLRLRLITLGALGVLPVLSLRAQTPASAPTAPVSSELAPDGAALEGTLAACLARYNAALPALGASPSSIATPDSSDWTTRFSNFLLYAMMPNGRLPNWGDDSAFADARPLLLRAADSLHREDLRYAATLGKKGKPPTETSFAYPQSGYFFLRSGWDVNAGYLALRNGALTARGHPDANSLVLSAYGNAILIDPGNLPSGKSGAQTLLHTVAHNTVIMDDCDTSPAAGQTTFVPGTIMDYYDGTNSGYASPNTDSTARHRRRILYGKPSLILISDDVSADQPHDWKLHFHFAPGQLLYRPTNQQITYNVAVPIPSNGGPVDPNTADVATGPGGLHLWSSDSRKPVLDRLPSVLDSQNTIASPSLSWTIKQQKSAHFLSFIQTFGENMGADQWIVRHDENNATVAVGPMDDVIQTILLLKPLEPPAEDAKPGFISNVVTDADAAVVRIVPPTGDKKGEFDFGAEQFSVVSLINATRLSIKGVPIFASAKPVQRLECLWAKGIMHVKVAGGENIQMLTLRAKWLIVNDHPRVAIPSKSNVVTITP